MDNSTLSAHTHADVSCGAWFPSQDIQTKQFHVPGDNCIVYANMIMKDTSLPHTRNKPALRHIVRRTEHGHCVHFN